MGVTGLVEQGQDEPVDGGTLHRMLQVLEEASAGRLRGRLAPRAA